MYEHLKFTLVIHYSLSQSINTDDHANKPYQNFEIACQVGASKCIPIRLRKKKSSLLNYVPYVSSCLTRLTHSRYKDIKSLIKGNFKYIYMMYICNVYM